MGFLLQFPSSEEEWLAIAEEFERTWQFPNCLGAVDGKHVAVVPPAGAGSHFFNYKGYHSIVLMGIANANYEFIYVDIGTNGRISDGGVLQKTTFFQRLNSKRLNLPSPRKPSGHSEELPYVFIGDEAFALRTDFMKPYPQRQSQASSSKRIYNYRVCRARRIIENVFGILAARFHIFRSPINTSVHNINKIVLACCVLHNFLRKKVRQAYSPHQHFDSENHENGTIELGLRPQNGELQSLQQTHSRNPTQNAKIIREKYETYFNTSGAVSWQQRMI